MAGKEGIVLLLKTLRYSYFPTQHIELLENKRIGV